MSNIESIEAITIAGGGASMCRAVGFFQYLEEKNLLQNVKCFSGTSFGAILSFMFAIGMSYKEVYDSILVFGVKEVLDTSFDQTIENLIHYAGMDDGQDFIATLIDLLSQKRLSYDTTFSDLYNIKGKLLCVCATRLTDNIPVYFNRVTSPNMRIIDAVRASMSVPFIFEPFMYDEVLYVDGGLSDNYPYMAVQRYLADETISPQNLFGLKLEHNDSAVSDVSTPLKIYMNYLHFLAQSKEIPYDIEKTLIVIQNDEIGLLDDLSVDIKVSIITDCYNQSKTKWP